MSIGECNVFTKLVPVTHRSLVLIEQTVDHSGYFFQLHLLGWNFNETKCQLTQSRTVYGFFDAIVFDERNSSKFALVYRKGCQRVRRGQIQDNKLKIDPRSYDINIGYGRSCFRFIDTKLQFLALGFEGIYSILISFYELDLGRQEKKDGKKEEKRPPRAKRLFVVEKEDNVDEHDLSVRLLIRQTLIALRIIVGSGITMFVTLFNVIKLSRIVTYCVNSILTPEN